MSNTETDINDIENFLRNTLDSFIKHNDVYIGSSQKEEAISFLSKGMTKHKYMAVHEVKYMADMAALVITFVLQLLPKAQGCGGVPIELIEELQRDIVSAIGKWNREGERSKK